MRRLGELSRELDKAPPAKGKGSGLPISGQTKSKALSEAGISHSTAQRCETLAKIPEKKFEAEINKSARFPKSIERYLTADNPCKIPLKN